MHVPATVDRRDAALTQLLELLAERFLRDALAKTEATDSHGNLQDLSPLADAGARTLRRRGSLPTDRP